MGGVEERSQRRVPSLQRVAVNVQRTLAEVHHTMFGLLGWIVFGLIVGAIAKLVMPGRDPGGMIVTMILGIVGAMLGGFIGRTLGLYGPDAPAGFFMALLGAVLLLIAYRYTIGARTTALTK